ncbi:MAG: PAS domain S-box protein, partial [Planctomycetota bacterium]
PNKELVAKIRANDRRVIEEGVSFDEEETIDTPDRRWTCLFHKSPLRDANGHIVGIIGVGIDITDRKQAEESLVASERKYRMLHETMTDAFVRVDMDGRIREFNKAYRDMLGYEAEEIYRLTYADLTPPKWHEFEAEIVRTQILPRGHSEVYSKEYRRKDGTMVPVELRTSLLRDDAGQPEGMWAIVRDITEREEAAAAIRQAREDLEVRVRERTAELSQTLVILQESEQRYRLLFATVPDAVMTFDAQTGRCIDANHVAKQMFGYTAEEAHAVSVLDISAEPENTKAEFPSIAEKIVRISLRQCRKKDGTVFPTEVSAGMFVIDGHKVVCGVFRDITERVEAEQKLHASEAMYRALVETTKTGYLILDSRGRVVDANAEYIHMTGHASLEELLGRSVVEWTAPYDQERNALEVARCIREGFVRDLRIDYVGRQGKVTPIEIQATVVPSGDDFQIIAISRDITGRVARQEAMRASEARYRGLFEQSPISLWEMDYSGTSRQIEELRASGVGDLREYFQQHPEAVDRLLASVRVIAVNEATLRMHGASSLEEMLSRKLGPLARETRAASPEAPLALARGQTTYR